MNILLKYASKKISMRTFKSKHAKKFFYIKNKKQRTKRTRQYAFMKVLMSTLKYLKFTQSYRIVNFYFDDNYIVSYRIVNLYF